MLHSDLRALLEAKLLSLDPNPTISKTAMATQVQIFNGSDVHELRYMLDQAADLIATFAQAASYLDDVSAIQLVDKLAEISSGEMFE